MHSKKWQTGTSFVSMKMATVRGQELTEILNFCCKLSAQNMGSMKVGIGNFRKLGRESFSDPCSYEHFYCFSVYVTVKVCN
jgi:hypothetical protein